MGRIVISENLSLDGVIQDPTGDEGFARGGWYTEISPGTREAWGKVFVRGTAAHRGVAAWEVQIRVVLHPVGAAHG